MHFLGIKWNNDTFKPSIQYREKSHLEGKVLLRDLNVGESIYFGIKPERYCIGYFGHPDYIPVPCPHTSMLSGDAARVQCSECQTHDSTLFLPLGSLSTTQRVLVKSQPHYNYINLFGSDLLKVGVAAGVRRYTRIHEQGAHATLFITECDGIIAFEEQYKSWLYSSDSVVKAINEIMQLVINLKGNRPKTDIGLKAVGRIVLKMRKDLL